MKNKPPKYCRHQNGQGYVTVRGKRLYLGKYGSEVSQQRYREIVERILAGIEIEPRPGGSVSVGAVVADYLEHAKAYYRKHDGTPTTEYNGILNAVRHVVRLYGSFDAGRFSMAEMLAYQKALVAHGYRRTTVNQHCHRVKRMFRWAAIAQMVPASIFSELRVVPGLRRDRSEAVESTPVEPVTLEVVRATMPYLNAETAAAVLVQLYCGMRPGEVLGMRPRDIVRTGDIWRYEPATHKTAHRGAALIKAIPPIAQAILMPFMECGADSYIFGGDKPTKTDAYRARIYRAVECANAERRKAREAGADAKDLPRWHPHQLRHTAATTISEALDPQAVQLLLGHATLRTGEVYRQKRAEAVIDAARKMDQIWRSR